MTRLFTVACALLCAVGLTAHAPTASAQARDRAQISETRVERAPIGQKGGLMNPVAWCRSGARPRVRTVVTGLDNRFRRVWRYRGSYPGMYFPRVAVGRYRLTTRASCHRARARRVEVATVRRKTLRTTISPREFRRIKSGMSRDRVRRIVGYDGSGTRLGRQMWRSYDMMKFWAYTSVEFRRGRVVSKSWNVDHD